MSDETEGPFTVLTRHVVVPAAIIAMVAAFLFYLVEVRSLFLEGARAFKQVGLCFAAATVLIARYGRIHRQAREEVVLGPSGKPILLGPDEGSPGQGFYTLALGVATLLFLLQRSSALSIVPNILIVGAVWRFATGVTGALSLEGDLQPRTSERRLYGVERLRLEEMQRRLREERGPAWGQRFRFRRSGRDAHGNPVAAVARLAALALLIFAVGEPFLLRGTPEVASRALADVIVFLFATGLVLAAGSAAGTLRHTYAAGGRASSTVLPLRIGVAGLLALAVLASALAIPGVRFQGQGRPQGTDGRGRTGSEDAQTDGRRSSEGKSDPRAGSEGGGSSGSTQTSGQAQRSPEGPRAGTGLLGAGLVEALSGLGRLLRIPFLLSVLLLILLALRRLGPLLPSWRSLWDRFAAWLRGLRPERPPPPPPLVDPFADLEELERRPAREAVLGAYQRLLLALEQSGYPRPDRSTPYEYLASLPLRLRQPGSGVVALTELYVLAAYADAPVAESERQRALQALAGLRASLWLRSA